MSREAADPSDLDDDFILEGLEQAEGAADAHAARFTGTDADDRASERPAAGAAEEVDDFDAPAPPAAAPAARRPADPATETLEDEEDEDAPIITREDGATWNTTAARWQKDGKFVEGEAPAGAAAIASARTGTTGTAPAPGAAAAAAGAPAAAAPPAATGWEPFAVKVDRALTTIPEAQFSRANGHHFLAIPDDKMAQFQQRIVRGVAAERMWRQLDTGLKDLERERELAKNRPAVRSDSEVEADMMLEVIKDRLPEIFDKQELDNLDLRIKLAQRDERDKVGQWDAEQRTQTTAAQTTETTQVEGIATMIVELVEDPQYAREFAALTDDDLHAVMAELKPVRNSLYFQDGKDWIRNTQYTYDRLKQRVAWKELQGRSTSTTSTPPASAGSASAPARTDATPASAGTTATPPDAATRADRLNRAHETAARPATTSVKAGRTGQPRPAADAAHHRTAPTQTPPAAQVAEDAFRKTTRSFLNSPGLDFDDPDE